MAESIAALYARKTTAVRVMSAILRALLILAGAASAFYWFVP